MTLEVRWKTSMVVDCILMKCDYFLLGVCVQMPRGFVSKVPCKDKTNVLQGCVEFRILELHYFTDDAF